ncbi:D-amino acid dehydrogenase small subunit [Oligella ureolytica]|uniref:NAD(P)/FAD-dependent oxidoreductase n=1 Tax=Oligella ureolytica TaxID=90244 RepID=UPI000DF91C8D|nr:FAD-dependent oxidoreductase [Oligella ureolytica]SUA57683.1 D-amino acid dehydrogenase small subunit [Oligella ureolytica]
MSNKIKSVVVVGGGIIGLSIALSLQSKGARVTLLERNEVGKGASWGNAGHLATEQVFPIADPSVLKSIPNMLLDPLGPLRLDWRYLHKITPWLIRLLANMRNAPYQKTHQALVRLNAQSLSIWETFARTWGLSSWIRTHGSLLVAEHENTAQTLKKHGVYLKSIGVNNQWLPPNELHTREPALAETQIGGLFYPDTGHIVDLDAVIQQLLHKFQELGGDVIQACNVQVANKILNRPEYIGEWIA